MYSNGTLAGLGLPLTPYWPFDVQMYILVLIEIHLHRMCPNTQMTPWPAILRTDYRKCILIFKWNTSDRVQINTVMQLSKMHCIVLDCISLRCTFGLHWMAFRSVQTFEPCALFPRWLWGLNRNRDEIIHHHSLTRNKSTHANAKSASI